jgi:hypothetical protein
LEAEIASKFKHFARAEKEKLYAKKQALQKKEKDGLLTELKKFHQTFKLNVPVPPDLVPLLSTGKKPTFPAQALRRRSIPEKKQPEQPVKKEESPVKKQPQQPPQQPPQQQQSQPQPPQQQQQQEAPSPTTTAASNSPSFKFNVKASEFKPNPSAPSFVPVSNMHVFFILLTF